MKSSHFQWKFHADFWILLIQRTSQLLKFTGLSKNLLVSDLRTSVNVEPGLLLKYWKLSVKLFSVSSQCIFTVSNYFFFTNSISIHFQFVTSTVACDVIWRPWFSLTGMLTEWYVCFPECHIICPLMATANFMTKVVHL